MSSLTVRGYPDSVTRVTCKSMERGGAQEREREGGRKKRLYNGQGVLEELRFSGESGKGGATEGHSSRVLDFRCI